MMKRMRNLALGVVVLAAGVIGLFLPVSVYDGQSSTVGCGNALSSNQSEPSTATAPVVSGTPVMDAGGFHPDMAAECESATSGRRHWAIPLVIVGGLGTIIGLVPRRGSRVR